MNPNNDLNSYKEFVRQRLEALHDIFGAGSIGDFSKDVPGLMPTDEFYETYIGIQLMIDSVREQEAELEHRVEQRTKQLADQEGKLKELVAQLKKRTDELERINKLMIDREHKMIDLKKQVARLTEQSKPSD